MPDNPFADTNPYAVTATSPSRPINRLLAPGVWLLVLSILSTLMCVYNFVFWTWGPLAAEEQFQLTASWVKFYSAVLLPPSVLCLAGAVAMMRGGPRWLQWAGAGVAVVPVIGPCYVLAIPFGIWAIVVLIREAKAQRA